jgi:hypothetical protein
MSLTATSPRVSRLRISRATPKLPDPMSRTGSYLSMMPSRAPAAGGGALACRGYAAAGRRQGTRRERRKEVGEPRARRGGAGRGGAGRARRIGGCRRLGGGGGVVSGAVVSLSGVAASLEVYIYSRCTVGAERVPRSVPCGVSRKEGPI